ncbi:hypothetical protein [Rhizobium sp. Root483D2]|uniref:hypothetical protein n=1 Tax=Rhizobium sp. Root483D2 TaxID=1736545 RepID=UPI000713DF00|nr:hypothetical protein [Rhizobium sp. Root483D2]KQY49067.1 hypothetical protein ASD32_01925 [Rhizobium sp. Root483D2]
MTPTLQPPATAPGPCVTIARETGITSFRPDLTIFHSLLSALSGQEAAGPALYSMLEAPQPGILIRATGLLSLDADSVTYVFTETESPPGAIFAASSEERMLDHIVMLLSVQTPSLTPRTIWNAIGILAGLPIAQIEHAVILATLHHHSLDFGLAATTLGLSQAELAERLKTVRADQARPEIGAA